MLIIETKHGVFHGLLTKVEYCVKQCIVIFPLTPLFLQFPGVGIGEILGLLPLWRVDTLSRIMDLGYILPCGSVTMD